MTFTGLLRFRSWRGRHEKTKVAEAFTMMTTLTRAVSPAPLACA